MPDRTTLTLPLVASLSGSLSSGGQAGGQADVSRLADAAVEFCAEPRMRSEIQRHLGLSSRSYLSQYVIKPLVDGGRLVQTIPDKPSSPNQRYVRT